MKDFKLLPLWVGIIAGCVALFGNYFNSRQMLKLEKKQFESNLILKSLVPNDSAQSIKNIRFLIKAGFISPDNDKLISLIKDTVYHIEFPKADTVNISPQSTVYLGEQNLFSAQIVDQNNTGIKGVKVNVFDNYPFISPNGKAFSSAESDENGLFKVAIPNIKWIRVSVSKAGYNGFVKLYRQGSLKSLKLIPLDKI